MRYRVTRPATVSGPVKADYAYEPGEILDSETAPEGHVARLLAAGALEPEAPAEDEHPAAAGEPTDESAS